MLKKITIIGSGVMGSSIAQAFAAAGFSVVLNDLKEELLAKAQSVIAANLDLFKEEGVSSSEEREQTIAAITYTASLEEAVSEADLIIEAIPEVIELKWKLYKELAGLIKPEAIVASNTSTFKISKLAEGCPFQERLLIAHFFNPGHLVPLVEVVKSEDTRPEAVAALMEVLEQAGKSPVLLNKEISGFIANRLQTALMREAFYLLKEGVASAEDIDTAVTAGPGFRWAFTGPIEIADFGGLDTWQRVFDNVAPELDESKEAPALIKELAQNGRLGAKTGGGIFTYDDALVSEKLSARDRHFIRLSALKKEEKGI